MKHYLYGTLIAISTLSAEPLQNIDRCSNCKKEEHKDKELQFAALNVLSTAVNGAFAVAANPDDRNNKLQFGNALANSFIGLIAAAMKSTAIEMHDAEGNILTLDQITHIIRTQLIDETR